MEQGEKKMDIDTGTVLYKLATELGLTRNTLEDRLKLQKTVYLLQAFGLHLGYGFSWYRYGPYSQELVYDAYRSLHAENQKYGRRARSLEFSTNTQDWLRRFKHALGKGLSDAKQLELLASVNFVRKAWHPEGTGFAQKFKEHKKHFFDGTPIGDRDIEAARDKLVKLETALAGR
jgi:hypothetical protein